VSTTTSKALVEGDGDVVQAGSTFEAQVTLANGRTGKTFVSTYDSGQRPVTASATSQTLFPALVKAVTGHKVGSRVLLAAAPADAYGNKGNAQLGVHPNDSLVMVADIVAATPATVLRGPSGKAVRPPARAPKLVIAKGRPTGFRFAGTSKPPKLQVIPLVRGTGPKVTSGSLVTVNYLGALYGSGKVFDASYQRGPTTFAIGLGQVIPAWDQGLIGARRGSRVLLLVPPAAGYGAQGGGTAIPPNSSLAFVVDILGVSTPQ
jgi:peptidylprolyl isomerase